MGKLINHDNAKAYLDSIGDPIVRALIQHAYSQIFVGDPVEFDGDFDLLFFFRILGRFLHDRERLAEALTAEPAEHSWVAD